MRGEWDIMGDIGWCVYYLTLTMVVTGPRFHGDIQNHQHVSIQHYISPTFSNQIGGGRIISGKCFRQKSLCCTILNHKLITKTLVNDPSICCRLDSNILCGRLLFAYPIPGGRTYSLVVPPGVRADAVPRQKVNQKI